MWGNLMGIKGYYSVRYSGAAGEGFGQITLDANVIVGTDIAGAKFEGTYRYNERTDMFDVELELTVPPDAGTDTGLPAQGDERKLPIRASIPRDLGGQLPIPVPTPLGEVQVIFEQIRDLPV